MKWNAKSEGPDAKSPLVALNLVLSFIFQEMQHTDKFRKWFYRKLSLELEELLQKTAMGKFFEKLTVSTLVLVCFRYIHFQTCRHRIRTKRVTIILFSSKLFYSLNLPYFWN